MEIGVSNVELPEQCRLCNHKDFNVRIDNVYSMNEVVDTSIQVYCTHKALCEEWMKRKAEE